MAFSVPGKSLNYWMERFAGLAVDFSGPEKRFDEEYISLLDPDGMLVELFADSTADNMNGWSDGTIPREHSIRKFYGATFTLNNSEPTEKLIGEHMGMNLSSSNLHLKRYTAGNEKSKVRIDIVENPSANRAMQGAGSVHHIAWRTVNDEEQLNWRKRIEGAGLYPTDVIDRNYFHSIYFREPGGILFEIATDPPGFLIDEDVEHLGEDLKLPEWYESKREQIERILIPLKTV